LPRKCKPCSSDAPIHRNQGSNQARDRSRGNLRIVPFVVPSWEVLLHTTMVQLNLGTRVPLPMKRTTVSLLSVCSQVPVFYFSGIVKVTDPSCSAHSILPSNRRWKIFLYFSRSSSGAYAIKTLSNRFRSDLNLYPLIAHRTIPGVLTASVEVKINFMMVLLLEMVVDGNGGQELIAGQFDFLPIVCNDDEGRNEFVFYFIPTRANFQFFTSATVAPGIHMLDRGEIGFNCVEVDSMTHFFLVFGWCSQHQ